MKDHYPDVHYGLSGAPVIYKNLATTGSHTQDSPSLGRRGDARAWDVRTGKPVWTFHSVSQPGENGHNTGLNDGWRDRSGANAWTTSSVDTETGTLYMTFDSPSYDFYGGDRPGNDLFGNSLVALDIATGKLKWYFQTIHHDVWDYDAPATPTLVDVTQRSPRWSRPARPAWCSCSIGAAESPSIRSRSVWCPKETCPASGTRPPSRSPSSLPRSRD